MSAGVRFRGQPLVVLGALLLGWTGARVTSFNGEGLNLPEAVLTVGTATAAQVEPAILPSTGPQSYASLPPMIGPAAYPMPVQFVPVWYPDRRRMAPALGYAASSYAEPHFFGDVPREAPIAPARREDDVLAGAMPPLGTGAPAASRYGEPATLLGGRIGRMIGDHARWSMDAWALIRKEPSRIPAARILPAAYGASQAGAVLRYQLAMQNPRQPTADLRTTSTLGGISETSVALGLSARPVPAVPIIVAGEGRLTQQGGSRRVQPAVRAVTALPPLGLPGDLRAEVYGQGGYVAGRYATPFADGQVRVDRALLNLGRAQARSGRAPGGGGIQKGASRLDAGPGATVSMPLTAKVFGRLAVD